MQKLTNELALIKAFGEEWNENVRKRIADESQPKVIPAAELLEL